MAQQKQELVAAGEEAKRAALEEAAAQARAREDALQAKMDAAIQKLEGEMAAAAEVSTPLLMKTPGGHAGHAGWMRDWERGSKMPAQGKCIWVCQETFVLVSRPFRDKPVRRRGGARAARTPLIRPPRTPGLRRRRPSC